MNRGDTVSLMLNYQINGSDLVEGAYDEIELQINNESSSKSIKKKLSDGGIVWKTITYTSGGTEDTFTGYVVELTQSETFKLSAGQSTVQLRIRIGDKVGSSDNAVFTLGSVLSSTVI